MEFIRFLQADPEYPPRKAEVIVSVGQIVKIEPRYYATGPEGKKYLTQVTVYGEKELMEGLRCDYILFDSLGNKYDSTRATDEGRALIERIWLEAR